MSKRLIYEDDAIDALMEILDRPNHAEFLYTDEICRALNHLPSAQPEKTQLSKEDATFDCISRKAAIDAFRQELVFDYEEQCTTFTGIKKILEALPSAQPYSLNEWCTDCKEYDQERRCCPRFNRVIRQTLSEQPEIIFCKDCANWDTTWTNDWSPNYHYCPIIDGVRKDDFYCADAERRTDG